MSSDSEYSESNDKGNLSGTDEDYDTYIGVYEPYEYEPLADYNDINDSKETAEEADIDGLTPSIL